ncbi:hypothetical protein [Cellulomonas aerilata]|uniref:Uncharacterized protein n=1 Tax=Cellulomonas aerilata TaxID=515326 RepID=A0A512D7Z4_9CELL|nr:hypothetical protein [Cellulomonas aerilata]GEO32400.1 hypothetical protein CAE01nite_01250 [Cellulomonas aerilata]
MAVLSEVFATRHRGALARSEALDAGEDAPDDVRHLELSDVTTMELEALGEIAARVLRFGTGDLELEEVDLDHESLFELPPFLCEVLTELGRAEDPEALADVAAEWARSEEMGATPEVTQPIVADLVELVTAAAKDGLTVYLWVQPV